MTNFTALHPALQHQIVNALGWRELRPFQDAVIPRILSGEHLIVLAPTAGGKTEAAFFPAMSRVLSDGWTGLSVLYICPIKALLNNLQTRLERYCSLVGRRCALWHGDVTTSARRKLLKDPPEFLLTTPESLEVMLISQSIDSTKLFSNLQIVIVDEIHAFAGDDRGWHLLSVLERASRLAGREIQRIGLSATVGNPEVLVDWLAGACHKPRGSYVPSPTASQSDADVKLDFVGSLSNAATVVARLHRGEKRLVFVDSRSKAENLSLSLRSLGVTTFVTHSSLSQEQRLQAEEAFANRNDCVIVATSVLELGVDVGNLDRVIQIDSPSTVASFLQRMGRTGRRSGTVRNCLFLATQNGSLLQAAGLIELWRSGFVEPIRPPALPYHILAQQLMAIALQNRGIGRDAWFELVAGVPGFQEISTVDRNTIVNGMLANETLWEEEGILWLGRGGEDEFGRRNFLDLFSVFTTPPIFTVLHGNHELGSVDQSTFINKTDGPQVLLLGGRPWKVNHLDWKRRVVYVEPTRASGRSQWRNVGYDHGLSHALAQSIKKVLADNNLSESWSTRARERLHDLRLEFPWIDETRTSWVQEPDGSSEWWSFAGYRANASLARAIQDTTALSTQFDSLSLRVDARDEKIDGGSIVASIAKHPASSWLPQIDPRAIEGLKFSSCLPQTLAIQMLSRRLQDSEAMEVVLRETVNVVTLTPELLQSKKDPDVEELL